MHYAIVDIGSNTVRMCVYCVEQGGAFVQLHQESRTPELLSHVENGMLDESGRALLTGILEEYARITEKLQIPCRYAFATAVFRAMANADAVCADMQEKTGWNIRVLSGEEEAACSFAGLFRRYPHAKNGVMIDMGGGSTELLAFEERACVFAVSEPFGCVSLRRQFDIATFPDEAQREQISAYVSSRVAPVQVPHAETLFLVGGTAKAMAAMHRRVYGSATQMEWKNVAALIERFGVPCASDEEILCTMFPERAYSVSAGMIAYGAIFAALQPQRIFVSDAGVREGFLIRLVSEKRGNVCEKN